jgi:tetratricopeptide (TPR) repeat protein
VTPGRNERCACGSGRKYKDCCGRRCGRSGGRLPSSAPALDESDERRRLYALLQSGHYPELQIAAQACADRHPDSGSAWQALAVALRMQGKDALLALQRAAQFSPHDAGAHVNYGNALGRLGNLDGAVASYRRALAVAPACVEAHTNLGNVLLELGRPDEALASCRRALEIAPDHAAAHATSGAAWLALGQFDQAVLCYRRALELAPDDAEAHNDLGNALFELGRRDEAEHSYGRAVLLRPRLAAAHANLANVWRSQGRLEEATAGYRRALDIEPEFAEAHLSLGVALRLAGCPGEAAQSGRRALELNPRSAAAHVLMAELHADQGRFAEAESAFGQAASLDPQSSEAWAGIVRVRRMTASDTAWLAAAERLAAQRLPPRKEAGLRQAMGKYFDDLKSFDAAFSQFQRANDLKKGCRPPYDRQSLVRKIDRIIHDYADPCTPRHPGDTLDSPRPVFIVGMLRSGTTLAEHILASHPGIFGAGELAFWNGASSACESIRGRAARAPMGCRWARDYLQLLERLSPDAVRVVDKMPANFLSLGLIHAALPKARIIHLERHPIDTCLSIYFQHLESSVDYANDLEDLAHYYGQYLRLMRHWRRVLPGDAILHLPYEGLVADPEIWSRRLFKFIGVPWDPRCLDFQRTRRPVITASKWQVRQAISTSSVGRWRHYANFVGPLRHLPVAISDGFQQCEAGG